MAAPVSAEAIRDVNTRYHDAAAEGYDTKWGVDFGDVGRAQVRGKLHKLLGRPLPTFEHSLEIGAGTGYFTLNMLQDGVVKRATATDISPGMLDVTQANAARAGVAVKTVACDAEQLPFADGTFDLVFAHGVIQYSSDTQRVIDECRRVLKPGGQAIVQSYNRHSWLNALSKLMRVDLEHEGAPVLRKFTPGEFTGMLRGFSDVRLVYERFPVKSRLHKGWKGTAFNTFFVGTFNALPRALVRRFGWHLLAFCRK